MRTALLLLALLAGLAGAAYVCPADKCKPPSCMCASTQLPATPAPQFVVLTNDDAATVITTPAVLAMLDKAGVNRNGCPLPATWFISIEYSQVEFVQQLYMKGHEIATHTYHHVGLPNATEIVSARTWLNQTAGVPLEKVRGFRGPFLLHNEQQREVLEANGFLYDSSITSTWGPGSFSPDGAHNVWPFTMDYGVPIDCTIGTGSCSTTESHPGLWEFPLWNVQDDDGNVLASMDPADGNITELYIRELKRNYNGNRAPVGVYLHAARLIGSQEVADQYSAFFRYALSLPDVWVVTIAEVLRWMVNPVPASGYNLSCPTPTDMVFPSGHFCLSPTGGCVQGTWHAELCACTCLNGANASLPGYCADATGACTVVKTYDFSTGIWSCPAASGADQDGAAVPPSTGSSGSTSSSAAGSGSSGSSTSPRSSTPPASSSSGAVSANGAAALAASSATTTTADVQPVGGVQFAFFLKGEVADFATKTEAVCAVLAELAGEAPARCSIISVTETAAPINTAARRLASTGYLLVVVAIAPANRTEAEVSAALSAAMQDGSLSAALVAAGVQLASAEVLSAAPSGKSVVGAAVGGAVGGAALVGLSLAAFLVVRARRARAGAAGRLPISRVSQDEAPPAGKHKKASPPTKGLSLTVKAGPSRLGEVAVEAYSSTPRGATPRHPTAMNGSNSNYAFDV
ncbi:hypothetical protein ABPG75_009725 [Micractinium tetrahymenae]